MNQQEVTDCLAKLRDETRVIINQSKGDCLIKSFEKEISRYISLVTAEWPLSPAMRETVDLGRVAVREYDISYPDYVTQISCICAVLRGRA